MRQPYHVTKREKEILQNVCQGLTANEIAENLKIASSTVENHKKNLYNKFNVRNSVQLALAASKYGYLADRE